MPTTIHRARWIIPVDSPAIENGRVVVDEGRIIAVERSAGSSAADIDHGDAVILPGFVNAHTHLELTHLHGCVPFRGSFTRWVEELVAGAPADRASDERMASIREGLRKSLDTGVTAIGDIGLGEHAIAAWGKTGPWIVGWLEVLGMGPRRSTVHVQSLNVLTAVCDRCPPTERLRVGLSPHAPYSVDPDIYRRAITYASATHCPICTHLAETLDEVRFLADGTGPLRELLERWDLWDGSFSPPRCSPVSYAHRLGLLEAGALLVHVNYASDDDLDLLARFDCSIAFCPRSHHFFGHQPHRFRDMLRRGINVCVGTDSLASNDSLSVLDELRFLYGRELSITPHELLHLGTLPGAKALGLDRICGSLTPGKSADFVVLPLESVATRDPAEDVLSAQSRPLAVYLHGEQP